MCLTRDRRLVTCNAKNGICGIKLAGLVKRVQVSGMLCGIGARALFRVSKVTATLDSDDGAGRSTLKCKPDPCMGG